MSMNWHYTCIRHQEVQAEDWGTCEQCGLRLVMVLKESTFDLLVEHIQSLRNYAREEVIRVGKRWRYHGDTIPYFFELDMHDVNVFYTVVIMIGNSYLASQWTDEFISCVLEDKDGHLYKPSSYKKGYEEFRDIPEGEYQLLIIDKHSVAGEKLPRNFLNKREYDLTKQRIVIVEKFLVRMATWVLASSVKRSYMQQDATKALSFCKRLTKHLYTYDVGNLRDRYDLLLLKVSKVSGGIIGREDILPSKPTSHWFMSAWGVNEETGKCLSYRNVSPALAALLTKEELIALIDGIGATRAQALVDGREQYLKQYPELEL